MTKNLELLNPYVKYLAEELVKQAKAAGVNIIVTSTLRTMAEQTALYNQGRDSLGNVIYKMVKDKSGKLVKATSIVTNAKAGQSMHNYALAFDIAVLNADGKTINWSTSADVDNDGQKDYFEVGAIGQKLGLTWDHTFKSIDDLPHYEWTGGLTLKDLQAGNKPVMPKFSAA